ncbi:HK97-gp10 family putative phage morphogenesis protein [Sansalvadorimonas verongulae]|uniref:HK97-gp10 family putative phage morphogenesis protein n=1 Tax=Sansalvadorimonas verongulae TaxID=2172824 RepID=UPI0012BCC591|nr:HK97-gp10 family putative phage morphogenesis protein [Sansalvadorimonas verongulae]
MIPEIETRFDSSVIEALDALENRLKAKALRRTMVEVAKPIKAAMKARAPSRTGALKRFISHKVSIDRKRESAAVFVGLNYKKTKQKQYVAGLMQERGNKHMAASPFIEPTESALDPYDIEGDIADFIQQQIDLVVVNG